MNYLFSDQRLQRCLWVMSVRWRSWLIKRQRASFYNTHFITEIKSQSPWWSSQQQNTDYTQLKPPPPHLHHHSEILSRNQHVNSIYPLGCLQAQPFVPLPNWQAWYVQNRILSVKFCTLEKLPSFYQLCCFFHPECFGVRYLSMCLHFTDLYLWCFHCQKMGMGVIQLKASSLFHLCHVCPILSAWPCSTWGTAHVRASFLPWPHVLPYSLTESLCSWIFQFTKYCSSFVRK